MVGNSLIVGSPLASILQQLDATVTIWNDTT